MHTPIQQPETREEYLARASRYADAHVRTTDGRCGMVIATMQRQARVISLVVRSCAGTSRKCLFRTDNEHSTISEQHAL